jgi:small-conductance mechanosensitive channel
MWHQTLFTASKTPITLMNLLLAFALLIGVWIFAKCISKGILQVPILKQKTGLEGWKDFFYYLILLVGGYVAFMVMGIDLTGIAVVAGAFSVGIGFGLQSVFNNFVAGTILLSEKKVKVGDLIELDERVFGVVKEISLRSMVIELEGGGQMIVPNTEVISKRVINWSSRGKRASRLCLFFTVDKKEKETVVISRGFEAVKKMGVDQNSAEILLRKIGKTSKTFSLALWIERIEQMNTTKQVCISCLEEAFHLEGIDLIEAKWAHEIG